jgi:signal transduction histidine kinase
MPDPSPTPLGRSRSWDRHGLQRRAVLLAVVGMLVPAAILAELVRRGFEDANRRLVRERETLARSVAVAVEMTVSDLATSDRTLKEARAGLVFRAFREDRSLAVELLDADGRVFASSNAMPESPDDVAASSPVASTPWRVRVRQPRHVAFAEEIALKGWLAFLTPLFLVVAALFAWGAARSVRRPLGALTKSAERLAAGDLSQPVPLPPEKAGHDDEIDRLGRAFETMRVALAASMEEVTQANATLERRVAARTRELEKLYAELKDRDARRADLVKKLLSAQEDERRRIARELHDETCQTVAALAVGLDTVRRAGTPEEASAKLEDVRALASRTLDGLHRVIFDLRPSVLDDLGLASAVRWWVARHLTPAGITARVETENLDDRLPPTLEIPVFRAVQEALTNVVRHSGAKTVLVQMSREPGILAVDVEDDGRGFTPADVAMPSESGQGLGLLGMRERIEILGGSLTLDSSHGAGTHVSFTVPIPHEEASLGAH